MNEDRKEKNINFVRNFVQINVQKMQTTTISLFRKSIKSYLDKVSRDFETLIINRGKDKAVVVISLEEYNSLTATQHELSSRTNEERLDTAIQKLNSGKKFSRKLHEE